MIFNKSVLSLLVCALLLAGSFNAAGETLKKKRLLVVSSYHKEYTWSQDTNAGLTDGLLASGYFDDRDQIAQFTINDFVETSQSVIKKYWLDTKRKREKEEIQQNTLRIFEAAQDFKPDLIFLGDDNAANHIGNLFLDTDIPIVFWGVNNTPVKYGLVDSTVKPGHNVTGVYQSGYYKESLELLKQLVPQAETFAILSDKTPTGRSHLKKIEYLARQGQLPFRLVQSFATSSYEEWQAAALKLQNKVDALFVTQLSALKDKSGKHVKLEEVVDWYVSQVNIPEATLHTFVEKGLLLCAADTGYNQGKEAASIGHDILVYGKDPASYPPRTPKRGPFMVNKSRAEKLGITLDAGIDIQIIE